MRLRVVVFVALIAVGIGLTGVRSPRTKALPQAQWPVTTSTGVLETAAAAVPQTVPVTTTTLPPSTTTLPPPTTTPTAKPVPVPQAVAGAATARDVSVYNGLGTWIDVYDWSITYGKDGELVSAATVDDMA